MGDSRCLKAPLSLLARAPGLPVSCSLANRDLPAPISCQKKRDGQQTASASEPPPRWYPRSVCTTGTTSHPADVLTVGLHSLRYISMVAAMCMVLYGYDASVFNSVQSSNNWLNWFGLDAVCDSVLFLRRRHCSIADQPCRSRTKIHICLA